MTSGYYPESCENDPNAPWNEGDTPCSTCEKPPEGFDCQDGENWEDCPRYKEEAWVDDDWEDDREVVEKLDRTTENECYAIEQGATTEEDIAALFGGSQNRRDAK